MSARIYETIVLGILFCGAPGSRGATTPQALAAQSVEFERRSTQNDARSPNGKFVISLLPPANEDSDPKIEARSDKQKIALGDLRRSAFVLWRPDSKMAALWDLAYSNHYFVRLVRVEPRLSEITGVDQVIRRRVLKEFHPKEIVHYWPHVKGWTKLNELFVVVCADGTSNGRLPSTPLEAFARGYTINVDILGIRSELTTSEYTGLIGTDPCK